MEEHKSGDSDLSEACTVHKPRSTVGIVLQHTIVERVVTGGSADKSGLVNAGDEILAVDGINVNHLSVPIAVRLRGDPGTSVLLRLRQRNGKVVEAPLIRRPLIPSGCDAVTLSESLELVRGGLERIITQGLVKEGSGVEEMHETTMAMTSQALELGTQLAAWRASADTAWDKAAALAVQVEHLQTEVTGVTTSPPAPSTAPTMSTIKSPRQHSGSFSLLDVFSSKSQAEIALEDKVL